MIYTTPPTKKLAGGVVSSLHYPERQFGVCDVHHAYLLDTLRQCAKNHIYHKNQNHKNHFV